MQGSGGSLRNPQRSQREFAFVPRIINPIKIKEVILFAADDSIRKSQIVVQSEMPWVKLQVLHDPRAVSEFRSDSATAFILDDVALNLIDVEKVRRNNHEAVIVLLSFVRLIQCSPPAIAQGEFPYTAKADLVFAVNRTDFHPDRIITSVVRSAEDYLNIERSSGVKRFILLIVDDEPSWPSQFLPILYQIIGQRAGVKITRTYEETLKFMFAAENENEIKENCRDFGHGDQVVCLITDVLFPKGGNITSEAGRDLIRLVKKCYVRIPIIIASKAKEATELRDAGFVLPKGDPGSLETLKSYIRDLTGIGDFVIHDEKGRELHRLKDIRQMYALLQHADSDDPEAERLRLLLDAYGEKDMFSTWFYMHSHNELGDRLRPQRLRGKKMVSVLKSSLRREILRMNFTPLIVDGVKVYNLQDLLNALKATTPEKIEYLSHDDIISSWLDRAGYSELAEELRPIHGEGPELKETLTNVVGEWVAIYRKRIGGGDTPFKLF